MKPANIMRIQKVREKLFNCFIFDNTEVENVTAEKTVIIIPAKIPRIDIYQVVCFFSCSLLSSRSFTILSISDF